MKNLREEIKFIFLCATLLLLLLSCATNQSSSEFFVQALFIAGVLGLITGAIANSKGHSFLAWFVFGAAIFIVAFPMVLFLKKTPDNATTKKCPQCAEIIQKEAVVCRYCQYNFTEDILKQDVENNSKIENLNDNENKYYCQKCGEELYLDEDELKNKKFTCPKCNFEQKLA